VVPVVSRVVFPGVTGSLAGIGKLPVLAGRHFSQYFFLVGTTLDLAGTILFSKGGLSP
jgi:hypothetical protein